MADKLQEYVTVLLFALAAISGGLGGCAIAAHHLLRGRRMRAGYILAYLLIGLVFGLLTAAYGAVFVTDSITGIIGPAIIAGGAGALVLSASNITAQFLLRRLGLEVVITMRQPREKGAHTEDSSDG